MWNKRDELDEKIVEFDVTVDDYIKRGCKKTPLKR